MESEGQGRCRSAIAASEEGSSSSAHSATAISPSRQHFTSSIKRRATESSPLLDRTHSADFGPMSSMMPRGGIAALVANLWCCIITPGSLALPFAFAVLGVPLSVMVVGVCALSTMASVKVLTSAVESTGLDSYEDIVDHVLGHWPRALTSAILFFYNLGSAVLYMIFTQQSLVLGLGPLIPGMQDARQHSNSNNQRGGGARANHKAGWWNLDDSAVALCVIWIIVLAPLSLLTRMSSLRLGSVLATTCVAMIAAVELHRFVQHAEFGKLPTVRIPESQHGWQHAFAAVSIIIFSFETQSNIHQVYAEVHEPRKRTLWNGLRVAMVSISGLYLLMGSFGALTYGHTTQANIVTNLSSKNDWLALTANYASIISAIVSYLNVLFPCRLVVLKLRIPGVRSLPYVSEVVSVAVSALALGLALMAPGVATLVTLLGASCSTTLSMVLPGLIAIRLNNDSSLTQTLGGGNGGGGDLSGAGGMPPRVASIVQFDLPAEELAAIDNNNANYGAATSDYDEEGEDRSGAAAGGRGSRPMSGIPSGLGFLLLGMGLLVGVVGTYVAFWDFSLSRAG